MPGLDQAFEYLATSVHGVLILYGLVVAAVISIWVFISIIKSVNRKLDALEATIDSISEIFESPEDKTKPIPTHMLRNGHSKIGDKIDMLRNDLRTGLGEIKRETSTMCNPRNCPNLREFDKDIKDTTDKLVNGMETLQIELHRHESRITIGAEAIKEDIRHVKESMKNMTDAFGGTIRKIVERFE